MFAVLALIVFLLALCDIDIGSLNMLYLGLVFLAAHFAVGGFGWYVWPTRRPPS